MSGTIKKPFGVHYENFNKQKHVSKWFMCVLQRKMTLFEAYAGLTGLVRNRIQVCI